MHFSIITLFPEMLEAVFGVSMIQRALAKDCFSLSLHQLRDYAINDYGRVDQTLAGGGTGMLLRCEPIAACIEDILKTCESQQQGEMDLKPVRKIFLSPKGRPLQQKLVQELAAENHLLILCGHYEGVDRRVLDEFAFEEISLGDFVLTGGEYGAAVLVDAVARLLPGVLPNVEAYTEESHYYGALETEHYTKPVCWRERQIPEVLLSGHHLNIQRWRQLSSWAETMNKRPDLFDQLALSGEDYAALAKFIRTGGKL